MSRRDDIEGGAAFGVRAPHGWHRMGGLGVTSKRSKRSKREQEVTEKSAMEIDPEELREFLEADLLGDQADPKFKEKLRQQLLDQVRARYGHSGQR